MKNCKFFKIIICFVLFIFLLAGLSSCRDEDEGRMKKSPEKRDFLIITEAGGMEEQTASYIAGILAEMGYTYETVYDGERFDESLFCCAVISGEGDGGGFSVPVVTVGFSPAEGDDRCSVFPVITPRELARAAVLLFPEAEDYTVISSDDGARDVQDACDLLDVSGVSYTVEALEERPYGNAVLSAAEKGCDVLILPSGDNGGAGIDLSPYGTAVVTVGRGEPVRGAAASFCIDTEAMARAAAELGVSLVEGEEAEVGCESFYSLCISEGTLSELEARADIEAVSEDFKVVLVE